MGREARLLLLPVALLLLALVALSAATRGFILVDTYDVLYGSAAASRCVGDGVLSACPNVHQFALLQYLPALAFHEMGFSLDSAANGLVTLNGLAVLAVLVLVTASVTGVAGAAAGAIAAALVLTSPLLWYAHGGYGEPLAAVAITGFVSALLAGAAAPWLTGIAMFLAGISKETAVPFMLALAVVVWLIRGRTFRGAELVAIAAGGTGAVAVNAVFNVFRYGTVSNHYYAESALQARPAEIPANVAALVASPTGGLVWMWPAVAAVICAGVAVAVRGRRLREPGLAVAVLFCVLLLALAQWHGPLGGTTWGPRLLLPWLPALLVLGLVAYPAKTRAAATRLVGRSRATAAIVCSGLVLTGLPHVIVTVDSARHDHAPPGLNADFSELVVRPFVPDATCPEQPSAIEDRAYDRKCLEHRTWHKGIAPVEAYGELSNPLVLAFGILWAAAVVGLIGYARVRARRQLPALA
jgi:hypothetical protein